MLLALVLLIWGPLLVISLINTTNEPNPPVAVNIRLTLAGYQVYNACTSLVNFRVSYRILSWGEENVQDGSRMIVVCESVLTHAQACVPTRGFWGMLPLPKKILNLDPIRLQSGTNFPNNILVAHTYVQ